MSTDDRRAIRAVVHGRVQGVAFRYSTLRAAERLGIDGWVANRPDGTVAVKAEGSEVAMSDFVVFLHDGPPAARVTRVDIHEENPSGMRGGFRVTG